MFAEADARSEEDVRESMESLRVFSSSRETFHRPVRISEVSFSSMCRIVEAVVGR